MIHNKIQPRSRIVDVCLISKDLSYDWCVRVNSPKFLEVKIVFVKLTSESVKVNVNQLTTHKNSFK